MAEGKHAMEKGKKEVKQETKESKQNDEIIEIKKENETLKIQLDETNDRLKRIAAEFDNYKKRNEKENHFSAAGAYHGAVTASRERAGSGRPHRSGPCDGGKHHLGQGRRRTLGGDAGGRVGHPPG